MLLQVLLQLALLQALQTEPAAALLLALQQQQLVQVPLVLQLAEQ